MTQLHLLAAEGRDVGEFGGYGYGGGVKAALSWGPLAMTRA